MNIFKLPDLGEGLPEGTIREWFVKEGDHIQADEPMVSIETAKALVEVPAPHAGTIAKCFAQVDETISTGAALVGFEVTDKTSSNDNSDTSNTVVGNIEMTDQVVPHTSISTTYTNTATPSARALARKAGIDLSSIESKHSPIRITDIEQHLNTLDQTNTNINDMQPLTAQRKAMAIAMTTSQQNIALTTICDEANISHWDNYSTMTLRMIRALSQAIRAEPILNSHFDAKSFSYESFDNLNLGIAIDTPNGLFAPVIKNANQLDQAELKTAITQFKTQAENHTLAAENLHGATMTLSNFGTIAGQFATPMITPPQVAILAVGKSRTQPAISSEELVMQTILPLSLSFDHRLVTGGEAARFLRALLDDLTLSE